jgi:hypothetical protein
MLNFNNRMPISLMTPSFRFLYSLSVSLATVLALSSCQSPSSDKASFDKTSFDEASWRKAHEIWQQDRMNELLGERGWAKVTGLDWLEEGSYRLGSAKDNDLILDAASAAAYVGTLTLIDPQSVDKGTVVSSSDVKPGAEGIPKDKRKDSTLVVQFTAHPDAEIWQKAWKKVPQDSSRIQTLTLQADYTGNQTILRTGSLQFGIIRRGGKLALRSWDDRAETFTGFHEIPTYPLEPSWVVPGVFKRHKTPKSIPLLNIIGITEPNPSDGYLEFVWKGSTYTLDVVAKPSDTELFVIFGDPSNAKETYGAGRYLYVDRPDTLASETPVLIDFNKAYNPPCAFTAYATCPLPPEQNKLPFKVNAGEKRYH